jgi:hypothetical protein
MFMQLLLPLKIVGLGPGICDGVSLLGIASAGTERSIRERVWALLAEHWSAERLAGLPVNEIGLNGLPGVFERMLAGASFGRNVVKIQSKAC